ncbi:DUF4355 domain-containing protein [Planococcus sp. ANT_H30]|uniref:DUF4355 domain-containing protein n=1 Tax=Planococcus sp. ANT_H30 TaxID=2597347 RepID=UPI0011F00A85|nr:DUF4355 domain-containing protein [Planococcus sp. ANT_H30]KAA0956638.1 DUF4355 domain-containing protein [Planococcus sp. ANT_H30]
MKINLEQFKTLVEAGDNSALEKHIHDSLERGDLVAAATTNKDVLSELDSLKDTHHKTALETWKTNQLPGLIEAKVREANPAKSPAEIALEDLQKKFDDSEKARTRETLKNKALSIAAEKKLPTDLLDFFIADDEDSTNENLGKLEAAYNKAVQAAVEDTFKANGRDPKGGTPSDTSVGATFAKSANNQGKPAETTLWD